MRYGFEYLEKVKSVMDGSYDLYSDQAPVP